MRPFVRLLNDVTTATAPSAIIRPARFAFFTDYYNKNACTI